MKLGRRHPSSALELGCRFEAAIQLFKTKREAANTLHISTDQLGRYIKGEASPPLSVLVLLAAAKGISLDWLATGEGSMMRDGPVAAITPYEKNSGGITIYDALLSLGYGAVNGDAPKAIGSLQLPSDYWRHVLHCPPDRAVAVYMIGNSMQPTLRDNDLAIIDTSVQMIDRDDIYAFEFEGDGYIKRLQKAGASVIVHSDNEDYSDWTITGERLRSLRIIGRVVGQIRRT